MCACATRLADFVYQVLKGACTNDVYLQVLVFWTPALPCLYIIHATSLLCIHGEWLARGLEKLVPAVAYHFCLNLPGTFSQPRVNQLWLPGRQVTYAKTTDSARPLLLRQGNVRIRVCKEASGSVSSSLTMQRLSCVRLTHCIYLPYF